MGARQRKPILLGHVDGAWPIGGNGQRTPVGFAFEPVEDILQQIAGYRSSDTVAAAVVMLTDTELEDWADRYRQQCLARDGVDIEGGPGGDPPREARWRSTSRTAGKAAFEVDHFLLRLPRGR